MSYPKDESEGIQKRIRNTTNKDESEDQEERKRYIGIYLYKWAWPNGGGGVAPSESFEHLRGGMNCWGKVET